MPCWSFGAICCRWWWCIHVLDRNQKLWYIQDPYVCDSMSFLLLLDQFSCWNGLMFISVGSQWHPWSIQRYTSCPGCMLVHCLLGMVEMTAMFFAGYGFICCMLCFDRYMWTFSKRTVSVLLSFLYTMLSKRELFEKESCPCFLYAFKWTSVIFIYVMTLFGACKVGTSYLSGHYGIFLYSVPFVPGCSESVNKWPIKLLLYGVNC